jgi:membrane protease YdiL (CAAX protease family)
LLIGLPLCFIWLFVEAGLVEEFFFRALIQSHLAAAFKSEVSGTVLMSLIFGLAHAPGFIFVMLAKLKHSAQIRARSTQSPIRSLSWQ